MQHRVWFPKKVMSQIGSKRTQNLCTEKVQVPITKILKELPRSLIMITLSSIWLHPSLTMPFMKLLTKSRMELKKIGKTKFTKWGHNQLQIKSKNERKKKSPKKRGWHFPNKTLLPNLAGLFKRTLSSSQKETTTHSREHWTWIWTRNRIFKIKIITLSTLASKLKTHKIHRIPSPICLELIWPKQT